MTINYIGKCLLIEAGEKKVLVIGDLHLGYEEALNKTGVLVSRNMFEELILYLNKIFTKIGMVNEVILLGDVKHVFGGVLDQEWSDVLKLFDYLFEKIDAKGRIVITKGNHDNILKPIVKKRNNVFLTDSYLLNEYAFLHGDKNFEGIWENKIKTIIIGHVHPAVKLKEEIKVEKYKCFLKGNIKWHSKIKELIVVPSFSEYSEGSDLREDYGIEIPWKVNWSKFDVLIVDESNSGDMKALEFGKLGKLK